MRRETSLLARVLLYSVLLVFTFMTLYPVFWLIVSSFKTTQEFQVNRLGLPRRWTCQNYPLAWKIGGFGHLFTNSIIYTVGSTAAVVLLSLSAGFAFAKIRSRATPFLHGSFVIGILLSVEAVLIPLFLMANTAGLTDTRLGILLPYIGMGMPKGIYLCTEYIKSIPDSLVESARIDGASYPRIFWSIVLPLSGPVYATAFIIDGIAQWNSFLRPLIVLNLPETYPLSVGLRYFVVSPSDGQPKDHLLMAAAVMMTLPVILIFFVGQRYFVRGVAMTGIKG